MSKPNLHPVTNYIRSVAMVVGTIIGAGMFGIPYAVSHSGFWVGIFFLVVLGGTMLLLNLSYGEVICRTKGRSQLTGYVERYLGKKGKLIALFAILTGFYGALVAYIIKVGELINFLLPIEGVTNSFMWSVIFFVTLSSAVLIGVKLVSKVDAWLALIFLIVLMYVVISLFPHIQKSNLSYTSHNILDLVYPYGVILFSLGGSAILPEVKKVISDKKKYHGVIIIGTIIPVVVYGLFMAVIVGTTGLSTSDDAIRGIAQLNPTLSHIGSIMAILTMSSAFLGLGTIIKNVFYEDFRWPYLLSWLAAIMPPFIIYLLGLHSFTTVIGFAGAVMSGIEGIIMLLTHQKAKKEGNQIPPFEIKLPAVVRFFIMGVFLLGIVYVIFNTIRTAL